MIMGAAKGPYKVYRDDIVGGTWPEMRLSGFPIIFERITHSTMQAIWNNVVTNVVIPRWQTNYDEAKHAAHSGVPCAVPASAI